MHTSGRQESFEFALGAGYTSTGQGPKGPAAECECLESGLRLWVVLREVMGSLWWPVRDTGFGFGPVGPEGPEGPSSPLGWMLVFCVRIEVVNSVS